MVSALADECLSGTVVGAVRCRLVTASLLSAGFGFSRSSSSEMPSSIAAGLPPNSLPNRPLAGAVVGGANSAFKTPGSEARILLLRKGCYNRKLCFPYKIFHKILKNQNLL